jgi:hypothetical protein
MAVDRKREYNLSPAIDGTQRRLDVLIGQMDELIARLTPDQPAPAEEPTSGETELREPAKPRKTKATDRDGKA